MSVINTVRSWLSGRSWASRAERSYDAGLQDRLNDGWRVLNQSGDATDRPNRNIVRARAQDLERNSDIVSGILAALERNVVGAGIKLQARTDNKELNKKFEALFTEWCKARNCDVTGVQTFNEILRTAVRRKRVDGGLLIIKRYDKGRKVPFVCRY